MDREKKVSILVFFNDDDISGIKINNRIFYRCDGEDITDFFNDKIIPTLKKYDDIDFIDYYKPNNITIIPEIDYDLVLEDIVTVSDKEKGNIILTKDFAKLLENQKIYVFRTYEEKFKDLFNFKEPSVYYEKVRLNLIQELDDICGDSDDLKNTLSDYFDEEIVDYIIKLDKDKIFDFKPASDSGVFLCPPSFRLISSNIDDVISYMKV